MISDFGFRNEELKARSQPFDRLRAGSQNPGDNDFECRNAKLGTGNPPEGWESEGQLRILKSHIPHLKSAIRNPQSEIPRVFSLELNVAFLWVFP